MNNAQNFKKILEHNIGFDNPKDWLEYARIHGFKAVKAVKIDRCPDCNGAPKSRKLGQYVYYSTLIQLFECSKCGLIWANAHIDRDVIRGHFEITYKDETYFTISRSAIFSHLVDLIDKLAPYGGSILDIGGARGDLMAQVLARRPDLNVLVNDVSRKATTYASDRYGLPTLTGDVRQLSALKEEFDVVVLSDVLYYEPHIREFWDSLSHLVRKHGCIIIRTPNKYFAIRVGQLWYRLIHTKGQMAIQDRVRFFNPEHIFIFRRKYLIERLIMMGFTKVYALPSPMLVTKRNRRLRSWVFKFAAKLNQFTSRKLVITPSMVVVGSGFKKAAR